MGSEGEWRGCYRGEKTILKGYGVMSGLRGVHRHGRGASEGGRGFNGEGGVDARGWSQDVQEQPASYRQAFEQ